jgi:glycosyltransferase involved in cell wall biosynthesis
VKILYHHRTFALDGQQIHIRAMLRAFREEGHELREVALVPKGDPSSEADSPPLAGGSAGPWLRRLLSLPRPVRELAEHAYSPLGRRQLMAANRGFGAELIYERYAFANAAGLLAARRLGIPRVVEVNSPLVDELSQTRGVIFRRMARRAEHRILSSADLVCTVSGELRSIMVNAGLSADRVMVLANGVHLSDYLWPPTEEGRSDARARLGLEDTGAARGAAVIAGFAGFFRRWHGIDLLIEALAARGPDSLHAALLGDGALAGELADLAATRGVADRVHFLGARPSDQIPALLPAFDIGVLPAITSYASPLKLIEYMAAGLAIVAPDQPNICELVADRVSALLFAPGDADGLARALAELAEDPALRRRLGVTAREIVEQRRLSWRANARQVVDRIAELPCATSAAEPVIRDASADTAGAGLRGVHLIRYGQYHGSGGVSVHLEKLNRKLVRLHELTIHQLYWATEAHQDAHASVFRDRGTIRSVPLTTRKTRSPPSTGPEGPRAGGLPAILRRIAILTTLGDNAATDILRRGFGGLRAWAYSPSSLALTRWLPGVGPTARSLLALRKAYAVELDRILAEAGSRPVLFVNHLPAEHDGLVVTAEAHRRRIPVGLVHHTGRLVDQVPVFSRARRLAHCVGAVHTRGLEKLLGEDAIELGNGVDVDFFDSAHAGPPGAFRDRHSQIRQHSSLIIAPGSIKERKRQNDVIEAARILVAVHGLTDFQLVFAGDTVEPGFRQLLDREVADYDLQDFVVFVGHLPEQELRQAYLDADVGVLASRFEGKPRVVLEMGAMGIPVVVTDVDGSCDTLLPGESGILVQPFQPARLAAALADLLLDEDKRRRFGRAGSDFVRQHHNLNALADRHSAFYTAILSGTDEIP